MEYLTIGFYSSETRTFAPGEKVELTDKEARPLLKHNHIRKIRTAVQQPPETREAKK